MRFIASVVFAAALIVSAACAQAADPASIGVVVMHGKMGMPGAPSITSFANGLESKGFKVMNLEMPWSKKRHYQDVPDVGVAEIAAAAEKLKAYGAAKIFVAGHSLGGLFAAYYAGLQPVDGLILIAPGGNTQTPFYQEKIAASVQRAQDLLAAGKGGEMGAFADFEGAKGQYDIETTAASYLAWFGADGALNQFRAFKTVRQGTPVLHVAPTGDYPALSKMKDKMHGMLPQTPYLEMYTPDASHLEAPAQSIDKAAAWIDKVAAGG